jgi:putative YhbY family RNA-binding protein
MAELELSRDERLALKARAHHLDPVVLLGHAGLTDAVLREIDRALTAHELVKIRVPLDDRAQREQWHAQIAEQLAAARVSAIGKLLIVFRPAPEAEPEPAAPRTRTAPGRARPARKTPARRRP